MGNETRRLKPRGLDAGERLSLRVEAHRRHAVHQRQRLLIFVFVFVFVLIVVVMSGFVAVVVVFVGAAARRGFDERRPGAADGFARRHAIVAPGDDEEGGRERGGGGDRPEREFRQRAVSASRVARARSKPGAPVAGRSSTSS